MGKRLHWIDITKAICMLCVYIGHTGFYTANTNLLAYIYAPFFVNSFFFINGYFIFKKLEKSNGIYSLTKESISGCIYKLVIPSIIFTALTYIPKIIYYSHGFTLKDFLLTVFGGTGFWFTSALTIAQIAIFSLLVIYKKRGFMPYFLTSLAIFFILKFTGNFAPRVSSAYFPWFWQTGLIHTIVITLGGAYFHYEKFIDKFMQKGGVILIAIICLAVYIAEFSGCKIQCLGLSGRSNALGAVAIISTMLLLINITQRLKINKFTSFVAKYSIVFYFLSGIMPASISTTLQMFNLKGLTLYASTLAMSIALSSLAVTLIARYAPFLIDLRMIRKK